MTADELISELAIATKEQMAAVIAPLLERIAVLESKVAVPLDLDLVATKALRLLPTPKDGQDAPPVDLGELAIKAAQLVPVPKDGKDAPAIDLEALAVKAAALIPVPLAPVVDLDAVVSQAVALAVKSLPVPKDGAPGHDGKDGRDVDAALLQTIVAASVERVLAEWPKPKDGTSLTPEDVAPLIKSEVAAATAGIRSGADGVGITGTLIDQDGCLQLTKSDGSTQLCGRVVGAPGRDADMVLLQKQLSEEIARFPRPKDGKDGDPGADGLGFDDLDGVLDSDKGFLLRFSRGEQVKEFRLPTLLDRGVYKPGTLYVKGSTVTAQGSLWIAQADTREKPGDGATSWRLAVKKGRDGQDLRGGPA